MFPTLLNPKLAWHRFLNEETRSLKPRPAHFMTFVFLKNKVILNCTPFPLSLDTARLKLVDTFFTYAFASGDARKRSGTHQKPIGPRLHLYLAIHS